MLSDYFNFNDGQQWLSERCTLHTLCVGMVYDRHNQCLLDNIFLQCFVETGFYKLLFDKIELGLKVFLL